MNAEKAKKQVENVIKALRVNLEPGEICPCCGHKRSKRRVSGKMIAANRENQKKAVEAIKRKAVKCQR